MKYKRLAVATALSLAIGFIAVTSGPSFARRDFNSIDPRCSWYKQQAMNLGRQARAATGQKAARLKAQSDQQWQLYYACVRGDDW